MQRREVLTAAVAAPALALTARAATASTETPVMALYRKWADLEAYANMRETSQEDSEAATARQSVIEKRLLATPSRTATDVVAKVAAVTAFGVFSLPTERDDPAFWAETRALIEGGVHA